jgi:hypothetical protein
MIRIAFFVCLVFLVVSLAACKNQNPPPLTTTAQPSAEKRELPPPGLKVEACSLLSKEEVGAIQNATMNDPAPSRRRAGRVLHESMLLRLGETKHVSKHRCS